MNGDWDNGAAKRSERVIDYHLLGEVDFDDAAALQRRLVYEVSAEPSRRMVILLCEHPELITVGRSGSRAHVRMSPEQLSRERIRVRWVKRGGGCILHAPGQLAVYPIVSLSENGWTVADFMERFQRGIQSSLDVFSVHSRVSSSGHGIWGRSGLLAAMGLSVRQWVTCHGAFINVAPAMAKFGFVDTSAESSRPLRRGARNHGTMSSLLAERRLPVRMPTVRSSVVASLSKAFECDRHNSHSGHPWLRTQAGTFGGNVARAS